MTDIILHHYDTSPYSEKVRLGFGLKGLAWASAELPQIMPKPNLTALTGGYRKTPVLQIGADIYCDSQLIMRELERRYPTPSFYPAAGVGLAHGGGRPWRAKQDERGTSAGSRKGCDIDRHGDGRFAGSQRSKTWSDRYRHGG